MEIMLYFYRATTLTMNNKAAEEAFGAQSRVLSRLISEFARFVEEFEYAQEKHVWELKVRIPSMEKIWNAYIFPTVNTENIWGYNASRVSNDYHGALAKAHHILEKLENGRK